MLQWGSTLRRQCPGKPDWSFIETDSPYIATPCPGTHYIDQVGLELTEILLLVWMLLFFLISLIILVASQALRFLKEDFIMVMIPEPPVHNSREILAKNGSSHCGNQGRNKGGDTCKSPTPATCPPPQFSKPP